MTGFRDSGCQIVAAIATFLLVFGTLSGCAGPTTIEPQAQAGGFKVSVQLDPPTLNPPQIGTLNYAVTDTAKDKRVTNFESVSDALMHTIVLSKDLTYFRHGFTDRTVQNQASIYTYFPKRGTFYAYTLFKPAGASLQVFTTTITSGPAEGEPALEVELAKQGPLPSQLSSGVRVQMAQGAGPVKVGQPAQFAFHVTERGSPVLGLWPLFGAPGHLWLVNESGGDFAHEVGSAESRQLLADATPAPNETPVAQPTNSTQLSNGQTTMPLGNPSPQPVPTLAAGVSQALATITAISAATLAPVQKTAQTSILETPAVQPSLGYGPDVIFTHTFPHAGLYKLWVELQYRSQVISGGYVVRVEP